VAEAMAGEGHAVAGTVIEYGKEGGF
jgi:hypothetical protein